MIGTIMALIVGLHMSMPAPTSPVLSLPAPTCRGAAIPSPHRGCFVPIASGLAMTVGKLKGKAEIDSAVVLCNSDCVFHSEGPGKDSRSEQLSGTIQYPVQHCQALDPLFGDFTAIPAVPVAPSAVMTGPDLPLLVIASPDAIGTRNLITHHIGHAILCLCYQSTGPSSALSQPLSASPLEWHFLCPQRPRNIRV